jgi:hypothetical protein
MQQQGPVLFPYGGLSKLVEGFSFFFFFFFGVGAGALLISFSLFKV